MTHPKTRLRENGTRYQMKNPIVYCRYTTKLVENNGLFPTVWGQGAPAIQKIFQAKIAVSIVACVSVRMRCVYYAVWLPPSRFQHTITEIHC